MHTSLSFRLTYPIREIQALCRVKRYLFVSLFLALNCVLLLSIFAAAQTPVPESYFGMQMHSGVISRQPWPVASFGGLRLWDSAVQWSDINTADGVFTWTNLDAWLAKAQQHQEDVLYTFGRTPQWASSDPYDTTCGRGPGQCDPPNDLNPDGTGTDQHWKNFVSALALHNMNSSTGKIKYWEIWNEAYNPKCWNGTIAQMLRMAHDASTIIKSVDPSAIILTPSVTIEGLKARDWLAAYLVAGGGQYSDLIAIHGYVQKKGSYPVPEDILGYVAQTRTILVANGQGSKPIWDTEASWGKPAVTGFTDLDLQAAFVARFYLMQRYAGLARFYWYQWNNNTTGAGTMWVADPTDPSAPGTVLKPGIAYMQVENWMAGATLTGCSLSGTIWTCGLSRPNGYVATAVWDVSQTCSNGLCTTLGYKVPNGFVQYRTLDGATIVITGSMIPLGIKPILLEN